MHKELKYNKVPIEDSFKCWIVYYIFQLFFRSPIELNKLCCKANKQLL